MLGSFGSTSGHDQEEEEDQPSPPPPADHVHHHHYHQLINNIHNNQQHMSMIHHHHHHHRSSTFSINNSPAIRMRQLLLSCAELISTSSDLSSAHRLLTILLTHSTPYGDSTERLVHHFTKALSLRLNRFAHTLPRPPNYNAPMAISSISSSTNAPNSDEALLQSSYLALNQITPFIRFSQLTANQAILDAIEEIGGQSQPPNNNIHILDFNIMHGLQWPPFMQAIVERYPPPSLRITGTGNDLQTLRRTGDRLAKFAHTLGLRFQFQPLVIHNEQLDDDDDDPSSFLSSVTVLPGEILAVNCVLYLHRLLKDRDKLRLFLHRIKGMNPKVVTVAEREANHNHPLLLQRFVEALDHYAAVFDSLEATLPPNSRERFNVETVWFGKEIVDIVCGEGSERKERHERFRSWEVMLRSSGFSNVPLSAFALSQAKLLLRLHYPSEGYQLHTLNHSSFFLGWQNQPLFSVSSWR